MTRLPETAVVRAPFDGTTNGSPAVECIASYGSFEPEVTPTEGGERIRYLELACRMSDLIIVDECHHVGAVSFDAILKRAKAKYVLGLTATDTANDSTRVALDVLVQRLVVERDRARADERPGAPDATMHAGPVEIGPACIRVYRGVRADSAD